jgi:hypothetical protein
MAEPHKALDLLPKDQEGLLFLVARGRAVESYALYEQSLAMFYSTLLGVSQDYAGVTFFRINNARARLAILERLLRKRTADTYSIFWNSLAKELRRLDERRNQVVHWTSVVIVGPDKNGQPARTSTLGPPNVWDRTEDTPSILLGDLLEFIQQCDFFSRLLNIFTLTISGQLEAMQAQQPEYLATWRKVFVQPVTYPPPDNHPLQRKT